MAAGDELLIVDANEAHREGMRRLFSEAGYVCTATASADEAVDYARSKLFMAAVVDLDVARPSGGLDLVRELGRVSPTTRVVLVTGRRSFEAAVDALRAGVSDVVLKLPERVSHLRDAVGLACERYRAGGAELPSTVRGVLDEAFQVMFAMAHRLYTEASSASVASARPRLLVVDSDQKFLHELASLLRDEAWSISVEMTGGSALDKVAQHRFDVVAVRDELVDLPGSMVVKALEGVGDPLGLLYSGVGGDSRIDRYQGGRSQRTDRPFVGAPQLVRALTQAVDDLAATERDRRVLRAFRYDHPEFFRRYAELKQRLERLLA